MHICLFNSAYIKNSYYKETQTVEKKRSNQIEEEYGFDEDNSTVVEATETLERGEINQRKRKGMKKETREKGKTVYENILITNNSFTDVSIGDICWR